MNGCVNGECYITQLSDMYVCSNNATKYGIIREWLCKNVLFIGNFHWFEF